jgi:hypothetical protein
MSFNWDEGFRRVRYAFITVSWLLFLAAQIGSGSTAAQFGEYSVYMFVFTVCCVLLARGLIWVVRGFLKSGRQVGG